MQGNSSSSSSSMQTKIFFLKHSWEVFFIRKVIQPQQRLQDLHLWPLSYLGTTTKIKVYTKLSYTKSYQQNFNLENMLHEVKENLYLLRTSPLPVVNDSVTSLKWLLSKANQRNSNLSATNGGRHNCQVQTTENSPTYSCQWSTDITVYSRNKWGRESTGLKRNGIETWLLWKHISIMEVYEHICCKELCTG